MLKWVVTRAPQAMCNEWQTHNDHQWRWNIEARYPNQKLDFENNNNIPPTDVKFCYDGTNSPCDQTGLKATDTAPMAPTATNTSSSVLSSANLNNTASSFRYFLVNHHSSPLKILRHSPIGNFASRSSTSPRRAAGYRRAVQRRQQRRRLSSLHIREPTELASPSYRQADDPANDLSGDLLMTPLPGRVTTMNVPATQWKEVLDIFAAENEHYNEREIKTPERITSSNHSTNQLVRRRAVRRRKPAHTRCTKDV
ncbi:uncharacterized protein LOC128715286 [Anopheles marshallii]|uniref:uncharacterized protein LOC128715286 n=1 Tax=Anopheles marshallii TaxID=1521116 RepID=UPI00237B22CE|nr:uncharacterized protein LOC128715286 [Anopheles marshallii]